MKIHMILEQLALLLHLSFFAESKKFLLTSKEKSLNATQKKSMDESQNDYMADIQIQSVDVGTPVDLKCVSPKEFSACFYSKTGDNNYYKIEPKASFQNKRLQCLCDVSYLEI